MAGLKPRIWDGVPIPYSATIPELRAMIHNPGPKAWAAIRALTEKPESEALEALIELTRSSDPHLRRSGVEAIGRHAFGRRAAKVVCQLLRDRSSFVVRAAALAAANLRLLPAHGRIVSLIKAAEESTRHDALRALEKLWHPYDFESVFDRYLHDSSDRVRKQATWTLHKNVGAEHWERVFLAWSHDPVPRHRVWACELAQRFGNRSVLPALQALEADSDGHVRWAAMQAVEDIDAA